MHSVVGNMKRSESRLFSCVSTRCDSRHSAGVSSARLLATPPPQQQQQQRRRRRQRQSFQSLQPRTCTQRYNATAWTAVIQPRRRRCWQRRRRCSGRRRCAGRATTDARSCRSWCGDEKTRPQPPPAPPPPRWIKWIRRCASSTCAACWSACAPRLSVTRRTSSTRPASRRRCAPSTSRSPRSDTPLALCRLATSLCRDVLYTVFLANYSDYYPAFKRYRDPSVCLSQGAVAYRREAALGYSHRGPPQMYGPVRGRM